MTTGAVMLAAGSFVAVGDILVALYFRSLADRVESGEVVREGFEPANARRVATLLIVFAPLMWLIFFLISFGVIPAGGIEPIQL
jgi:hypothetical protein